MQIKIINNRLIYRAIAHFLASGICVVSKKLSCRIINANCVYQSGMAYRTLSNMTFKSFSWIEPKIVGIKNAAIEKYHAISHKNLPCNFSKTCYWLNRHFEFVVRLQRQSHTTEDKPPMTRQLLASGETL